MMRHVLMLSILSCPLVYAQFIGYPTPGLPKNPNGTPNLNAPAPKTADGKPDLTGVWDLVVTQCRVNVDADCDDRPAVSEFANIAAKVSGGLPMQPWAAALTKERAAQLEQNRILPPFTLCRPSDLVRLLTFPPPRKFIQTAGVLVMLSERDVTFRQVFLDGRPLPKDPQPSYHGYSVARWEGDTLVVQTNGLRDDVWLDGQGHPLTADARVTERYRRPTFGKLELDLTIDDPKAYTRPWSVKLTYQTLVDDDLLEYFCQENEKDIVHLK
jgi:hypothetical protein